MDSQWERTRLCEAQARKAEAEVALAKLEGNEPILEQAHALEMKRVEMLCWTAPCRLLTVLGVTITMAILIHGIVVLLVSP